MKTNLALLLLACFVVQAQVPPPGVLPSTAAAYSAEEQLRQALRASMDPTGPSAARTNLVTTNALSTTVRAEGAPAPQTPPAAAGAAPGSMPMIPTLPVATSGTNATSSPRTRLATTPPLTAGATNAARTTAASEAPPTIPAPGVAGALAPGLPDALAARGPAALPTIAARTPQLMDDIPTNTFNFPAIDLNTFLDIYSDVVGRTILRPSALPAATLTLKTRMPLTRKEAIQALDTVLAMNGITTIPVGQKFIKVVPTQSAFQEPALLNRDPTNLPEAGQLVNQIVQLKFVRPSEIISVLQQFAKVPNSILPIEGSQMLVIRDFAENVRRMLEMITEIDVAIPSEFESVVIPIKYALCADIQNALSSLGGTATTVGNASPAGAAGGRSSAGSRPSNFGSRGGAGTGGIPGMPNQPGVTPLGGAQPAAAAGQQSYTDRLRGIITRASATGGFELIGPNKIIADERTNSLLVFASREDLKTITNIIAKLDVVLAQVIIEALIMEVTVGDKLDYGVSWLQQPKTSGQFTHYGAMQNSPSFQDPLNVLGGGTNSGVGSFASGLSWFGKYGNDFDVAMQAAASDNRVHILSRPRIQTSHAVPGNIQIGTSQPIVTGTYNYYGGGPQTQFAYQNFGIQLDVTPLVNPDGLVVMDISQQIQSINGYVTVSPGLTQPILANRSANAKVAVKTGESVMLGGFISSNVSDTKSGVPILKDIPLLGALFSGASKSHDRTELIVLIRPTVLQTPDIAAKAAIDEQNKLPLVKHAEADEQSYRNALIGKMAQEDEKRKQHDAREAARWPEVPPPTVSPVAPPTEE